MKPILDISSWQNPKNINYDTLAAAISGVIIRATYGTRKDAYFEQHYAEFVKRGVPVGVYGFITEYMDVELQVAAFVQACAGKTFQLGYWGDVEAEAGAELLTLPTIRKWLTLADAKLGIRCGIYTSWWMWQQCANNSLDFGSRPLWVAHYGVNSPRLPSGWTNWVLHQFSSTTFHPGYNYVLDTNRFNGDDAKYQAFIASNLGGVIPEPEPEPEPLWIGTVTPEIGLNVRSGHSILHRVIRTLPQGMKVGVFEEYGTWARIAPDKQEWVAKRYLAPVYPPSPDVLSISPLCQRLYNQVYLGTSNTTIASYGCLLTCVTMYANYLLGKAYTPPEMNKIIKDVNGFVNGNLFRFASLWEAFPNQIAADKFIRTPLTPAPLAEIDAVLADNRPVIVETRQNKRTEHWVLIVGKRDNKYVINDPWTGKQVLFEDVYGEPARWIYSIVSYRRK